MLMTVERYGKRSGAAEAMMSHSRRLVPVGKAHVAGQDDRLVVL